MWWGIGYVLKKYVQNRDIVILGDGYNALKWAAIIKQYADIKSQIQSCHAAKLDCRRDYVVICNDIYGNSDADELKGMGFNETEDYYDWTKYDRTSGHLPIDVECNGTTIGRGSYFSFPRNNLRNITSIGRYCSIASTAVLQGNHSMNRITTSSLYPVLNEQANKIKNATPTDKDPLATGRKVTIGNDVWIGANVFISASKVSQIGNGAIIGAGSLVMHDVPPYAIVYGSPAKVAKYRFDPEQIKILEQTKWWDWDIDKLNENIEFLMYPEKFFAEYMES